MPSNTTRGFTPELNKLKKHDLKQEKVQRKQKVRLKLTCTYLMYITSQKDESISILKLGNWGSKMLKNSLSYN